MRADDGRPAAPDEGRAAEAAKPLPDSRPSPFDASRRPSGRARTTATPPCAQALSQWERGVAVRGPSPLQDPHERRDGGDADVRSCVG